MSAVGTAELQAPTRHLNRWCACEQQPGLRGGDHEEDPYPAQREDDRADGGGVEPVQHGSYSAGALPIIVLVGIAIACLLMMGSYRFTLDHREIGADNVTVEEKEHV
jgi:hypothetical protein